MACSFEFFALQGLGLRVYVFCVAGSLGWIPGVSTGRQVGFRVKEPKPHPLEA